MPMPATPVMPVMPVMPTATASAPLVNEPAAALALVPSTSPLGVEPAPVGAVVPGVLDSSLPSIMDGASALDGTAAVLPLASPASIPVSPAVTATEPPALFFGDVIVVQKLIEQARAEDASEQGKGAGLWARARALAPADPRLPAASGAAPAPCDMEHLLAAAEVGLSNHKPAEALEAFRRARVCDPNRSAPLWGLSRAFDALGARAQAKHHARLYVLSSAPDRDPTSSTKAAWRCEQPE